MFLFLFEDYQQLPKLRLIGSGRAVKYYELAKRYGKQADVYKQYLLISKKHVNATKYITPSLCNIHTICRVLGRYLIIKQAFISKALDRFLFYCALVCIIN